MSADDERSQLVTNHEFNPVDYGGPDERKRHRRRLCVTAAVVCCVGVGLCLAIALPLTTGRAAPSDVTEPAGGVQATGGGRMVLMQSVGDGLEPVVDVDMNRNLQQDVTETQPAPSPTSPQPPSSTTTERHRPTRRHRTTTTTSAAVSETTIVTTPITPSTAPSFLPTCPMIPSSSRRSEVDMNLVNGTTWYELHRIQTFNSPAFVPDVSCSTMELTIDAENLTDAQMMMRWEEGAQYFRIRRQKLIELRRPTTSCDTWIEQFNTSSIQSGKGQINFLAMLNNYLLVYECFPGAPFVPKPGYMIRVYSGSPTPDYSRVDEALLLVAQYWGLNPEVIYPRRIRQRFCDQNVGHA